MIDINEASHSLKNRRERIDAVNQKLEQSKSIRLCWDFSVYKNIFVL